MSRFFTGIGKIPCSLRIVFIFSVSLYLQVAVGQPTEIRETKLELVQVIFRHGNRTPEFPYYGDPNAFESFQPYGWNTLDKAGYQRAYNLGVYLRKLYGDFISDNIKETVRIWTTDVTRAKISAQLVANGLFPPSDDFKWGPPGSVGDLWQPVPYEFIPIEKDNFMYMKRIPCPAYHKEINSLKDEPIVQAIYKNYADLINDVYTYAKPPSNRSIPEIARLYQSLVIESYNDLTTPEWAKPYFPGDMLYIAITYRKLLAWTKTMQRLTGGPLLGHIIRQMEEKQEGSKLKIGLYSGHDDTLSFLGMALRIWGDFFPDFSSALIVELHSNTFGQYFVRTFFHNDTSKPPMQLTVPGCQKSCELKEFRRILNDSIPVNHAAECMQLEMKAAIEMKSSRFRVIQIGLTDKTKCSLRMFVIFSLLLYVNNVFASPEDVSDLRLELVQVIFRHGNRTPLRPYPNDPNVNETYYPYGWDSLDRAGRQSSYNLGVYLNNLYRNRSFIDDYDLNEVTIWSTDSPRTRMSADLVAAGLFPPNNLKWDVPGRLGNIWIPVSIDSVDNPLNNDFMIYLHRYSCPAYFQLIHEQNNGPPFEWLIKSDPELVRAYEENTGSRDVYLIAELYSTCIANKNHGIIIPDWILRFYPDRLKAFSERVYYMFTRTDKMVRLRIGAFLRHIIKQMALKESGSKQKFFLYSGHDLSISFLGKALGVWNAHLAEFSSAMIIELLSNPRGRHFVSVHFHNDTSRQPTPLTVPGCGTLCPFNQFRRLFDEMIPANQTEECIQVDGDGQRFFNPPDGWVYENF